MDKNLQRVANIYVKKFNEWKKINGKDSVILKFFGQEKVYHLSGNDEEKKFMIAQILMGLFVNYPNIKEGEYEIV